MEIALLQSLRKQISIEIPPPVGILVLVFMPFLVKFDLVMLTVPPQLTIVRPAPSELLIATLVNVIFEQCEI